MLPTTPTHELPAPSDRVPLALFRGSSPTRDGPQRGPILLVHGLGEHAGRYRETARVLHGLGFQVWAMDQRGHGQSAGVRGGLPSPWALVEDLEGVVDFVLKEEGSELPLTLLGHSMGGAVCARAVARSDAGGPIRRLILSSPALALGLSPLMTGVAWMARRLLPDLSLSNGLNVQGISRDPSVVRAYREDPWVHDRITPALAGFLLDTEQQVLARAPTWPVPTLVLWAGADLLVDPQGSQTFVRRAPADIVEGKTFPYLYHEILNEPERADVFEAVVAWLDREGER